MMSIRRHSGRGLWLLCFAYLIFTLSPHFATVRHAHALDDEGHHHAAAGLHDAVLERAILIAVETAPSEAGPRIEIPVAKKPSSGARLPQGTRGLRASEGPFHAHGREHPNLLSLPSSPREFRSGFARLSRLESPPVSPAEASDLPASARAPPAPSALA